MACCYMVLGDSTKAEQNFLLAIEGKPNPAIYAEHGQFLYQQQRYEEAIKALEQCLKLAEDNSGLSYGAMEQAVIKPQLQALVSHYGNINIKPAVLADYLLAGCQLQCNHLESAQSHIMSLEKRVTEADSPQPTDLALLTALKGELNKRLANTSPNGELKNKATNKPTDKTVLPSSADSKAQEPTPRLSQGPTLFAADKTKSSESDTETEQSRPRRNRSSKCNIS